MSVRRGRLFHRYVTVITALVTGAVLVSALVQGYFAYGEHQAALIRLQQEQAAGAAAQIKRLIQDTESQLRWAFPPPGAAARPASATRQTHRLFGCGARAPPPLSPVRVIPCQRKPGAARKAASFLQQRRPVQDHGERWCRGLRPCGSRNERRYKGEGGEAARSIVRGHGESLGWRKGQRQPVLPSFSQHFVCHCSNVFIYNGLPYFFRHRRFPVLCRSTAMVRTLRRFARSWGAHWAVSAGRPKAS